MAPDITSALQAQPLAEQVASIVLDFIPDEGPFVVIRDREGKIHTSDEEAFDAAFPDGCIGSEIIAKIDDGFDPLIDRAKGCTYIGSQLFTEQTNCGYLFIVLPGYTPQTALANIALIETLMNQISLIARLIESNNQLRHLKHSRSPEGHFCAAL